MDCYECHIGDRRTTAVAVCRNCGAALCPSHLHSRPQVPHRVRGTGPTTGPPAARRILCPTCSAAESTP
ncbi:DUF2180 family protein [Streptomyces sp. TP-A0874]|uniref:DUF2180 family protein n=1 Tax=Streptomyces sp. TP-A0874 TaxID=549819 RepID=UPI00099FD057|nr:DUF2180 family protein [Streptomyces sp. TP-A0874]